MEEMVFLKTSIRDVPEYLALLAYRNARFVPLTEEEGKGFATPMAGENLGLINEHDPTADFPEPEKRLYLRTGNYFATTDGFLRLAKDSQWAIPINCNCQKSVMAWCKYLKSTRIETNEERLPIMRELHSLGSSLAHKSDFGFQILEAMRDLTERYLA